MNATPRYECGKCEKLHEEMFDAFGCCAPLVTHVWICGKCEKQHYSQADGEACCTETSGLERDNNAE